MSRAKRKDEISRRSTTAMEEGPLDRASKDVYNRAVSLLKSDVSVRALTSLGCSILEPKSKGDISSPGSPQLRKEWVNGSSGSSCGLVKSVSPPDLLPIREPLLFLESSTRPARRTMSGSWPLMRA